MKNTTPRAPRPVSENRTQKHPSMFGVRPAPAIPGESVLKNIALAKSARAEEAGKATAAPSERYGFALPPGTEDLAPVFADASVTAPLNAAQHLHLSQLAIRHRCTVGELVTALALSRIDMEMEEYVSYETHEGREYAINDALLRFVDSGRTPMGGPDFDLPHELTPGPLGEHKAFLFRKEHGGNATHLAYLAGDADAYEKEDEANRIREARKPWAK